MKPTIDIVIPTFNGKHLLAKHLPSVIKNTDHLNKIIVVDNGSNDGTVEWLETSYPEIVVLKNKTNLGYTVPINQGVAVSSSDYLVLLNNDVQPGESYLKNIFRYFEDENVFAVSFNEKESSWPLVSWEGGKLQYTRGADKTIPHYSTWASGGSAIFRRSIWNKLGGLNEVYAPFYWEDIDIGYRAWKTGYQIIWDPGSVVYHQHESTAKSLNQNKVSLIRQRNELLFTWINITDRDLLKSHFRFLFTYTLTHPGYLKVILSALTRLPSNQQKKLFTRTDKQVISLVNQKYE